LIRRTGNDFGGSRRTAIGADGSTTIEIIRVDHEGVAMIGGTERILEARRASLPTRFCVIKDAGSE
jgi:hypothetical protein